MGSDFQHVEMHAYDKKERRRKEKDVVLFIYLSDVEKRESLR